MVECNAWVKRADGERLGEIGHNFGHFGLRELSDPSAQSADPIDTIQLRVRALD
jgi:hypothetical protein